MSASAAAQLEANARLDCNFSEEKAWRQDGCGSQIIGDNPVFGFRYLKIRRVTLNDREAEMGIAGGKSADATPDG